MSKNWTGSNVSVLQMAKENTFPSYFSKGGVHVEHLLHHSDREWQFGASLQ